MRQGTTCHMVKSHLNGSSSQTALLHSRFNEFVISCFYDFNGKRLPEIKIILSSPEDVVREREIVKGIVSEINNDHNKYDYFIRLYRCEDNFISDWSTYQEKTDRELDDTDIFIGILRNRFGSPTKKFISGTEEEFEDYVALTFLYWYLIIQLIIL